MAKATKPLGGAQKDKYFRDLFAAEPDLTREAAKRLAETTKREVTQVRVRLPLPERRPLAHQQKAKPEAEQALSQSAAADKSLPTHAPEQPAAATFDPFQFTAVVVLKRQGAAALEKLLAEINEPDHLRLLAEKQHLGLPQDATTATQLRGAILAAAQARIDDRRAAAS